MEIYELTIEIVIGFFMLLIITKFIRKTQINQITPFDFVSAIVLGELLGNTIYDNEIKIMSVIYAISLWGVLMYIVEKTTQKFRRTRKFLDGDPAIIIRNGQIDYNVLKKEKLDLNGLMSMLRQKDVFSVREVEFGILEQSGYISILKKSKYNNPTIEDLGLIQKPVYLPFSLVLDGEILYDNLKVIQYDENWLRNEINKFGLDVKDVLYAEWKQDEGLHVIPRNKN